MIKVLSYTVFLLTRWVLDGIPEKKQAVCQVVECCT